jgi:hypothetical protein
VHICITLDGTELTKDLRHLTFGVKVTDSRAIDPRDRSPLSYNEEGKESALTLIKQVIICIMHMENCIGEKLITVLLSVGASKYQEERSVVTLEGYVNEITQLVHSHILGTRVRPKIWKFPLVKDGKEVRLMFSFYSLDDNCVTNTIHSLFFYNR